MYHSSKDVRRAIDGQEEVDLARMFDGSDYNIGKIETLEQTVENLSLALSRLLLILIDAHTLTKSQVTSIISGSYDDSDGDDEG